MTPVSPADFYALAVLAGRLRFEVHHARSCYEIGMVGLASDGLRDANAVAGELLKKLAAVR